MEYNETEINGFMKNIPLSKKEEETLKFQRSLLLSVFRNKLGWFYSVQRYLI